MPNLKDIARCTGEGCKLKETCLRYMLHKQTPIIEKPDYAYIMPESHQCLEFLAAHNTEK